MGKGLGKDRRKLQWLPPFRPRVASDAFHSALAQKGVCWVVL